MKQLILLFLLCSTVLLSARNTEALIYKVQAAKVATKHPPIFFLLHGYGSNEDDLLSLSTEVPANCITVSIRAPYPIAEGSYKWYDFSVQGNTKTVNEAQLNSSSADVLTLIHQLCKKYKANTKKIIIGGFSQGAIMSYELATVAPNKFAGIVILSGRLLPETQAKIKNASALAGTKILVMHGTTDNIIAITEAQEAKTFFAFNKIPITYKTYNMAHSITAPQLADLKKWLAKTLQ
jgi:phospholipase/carboxylesterase